MANWKTKLDISDLHEKFRDKKLNAKEVATEVTNRLKKMKWFKTDLIFQDISEEFEMLDVDCEIDDYDEVLGRLYDWGDLDHKMWIDAGG